MPLPIDSLSTRNLADAVPMARHLLKILLTRMLRLFGCESTVNKRELPMLVLSRRTNEQILLPDLGVVIEVLLLKGNQVRLGISAPKEIKILRSELAFEESSIELNEEESSR